jgi:glc operon protein GlcG
MPTTRTELTTGEAQEIVESVTRQLDAGQGAAVAVVDPHGELIAFLRTPGCGLPPINIAINKAFTAARTGGESRLVGDRSRNEGFPVGNFGDARYVGWGGGVPIIVGGAVIGAVGVSGLTEDEDMALARAAAAAVTGADREDAP